VAAVAGVCLYGETLIRAQYFGIFLTISGLIIINVAPNYAGTEQASLSDESLSLTKDSSENNTMGSYGTGV
jgi:drug/metabolite transporter (DMT)-like permease